MMDSMNDEQEMENSIINLLLLLASEKKWRAKTIAPYNPQHDADMLSVTSTRNSKYGAETWINTFYESIINLRSDISYRCMFLEG
jgi:hypothetical protein